jgi:integrase
VIAAWEANGRRWPSGDFDGTQAVAGGGGTPLAEIIRDYWRWAEEHYRAKHMQAVVGALRLLRQYSAHTPATDFGPQKLRLLREAMIRGDPKASPPRTPWSRKYINSQVQRIRHIFKWAAAREMVPASVHQALCTLEALKRGRSAARETAKVGPVPQHLLDGTRNVLTGPVRALVELQLLTGARPGESLEMRLCDLEMDRKAGIWIYRPEKHKNAYRERERIIFLGPKAQDVLEQYVTDRHTMAYLFSPAEADVQRRAKLHAERKTPLSCGNRPGSHIQNEPQRSRVMIRPSRAISAARGSSSRCFQAGVMG